jgi:hypothetical protein
MTHSPAVLTGQAVTERKDGSVFTDEVYNDQYDALSLFEIKGGWEFLTGVFVCTQSFPKTLPLAYSLS